MTELTEPPRVEVLDAFRLGPTQIANPILEYPGLFEAVHTHAAWNGARWGDYIAANGLEGEDAARELAKESLIQTALALHRAGDDASRQLWSERFTQASLELFGEPDPAVATHVLSTMRHEVAGYAGNKQVASGAVAWLLGRYDELGVPAATEVDSTTDDIRKASRILGEAVTGQFEEALRVFTGDKTDKHLPERIADLFDQGLTVLKRDNVLGPEWKVILDNGTALSTRPEEREIVVGRQRAPASLQRLRALFGHEVLVHVLRAANGARYDPQARLMELGMPGSYVAEEGIAKLVELGLTDKEPSRGSDSYANVALALGTVTRRPLERRELFVMTAARSIIRMQAKRSAAEIAADPSGTHQQKRAHDAQRLALNQVNRVYRGSLGNEHIAVNTKDIIYYQGLVNMSSYVIGQLQAGKTPQEIFAYITLGKFDPTDSEHREYVQARSSASTE